MDEWFWIVIAIFLGIALLRKDKELLGEMPKKKREKVLKERRKVQKKNIEGLWIILGIVTIVIFIFFLWIAGVFSY